MKISLPQIRLVYFCVEKKSPLIFFTLGALVDFQHQTLITES